MKYLRSFSLPGILCQLTFFSLLFSACGTSPEESPTPILENVNLERAQELCRQFQALCDDHYLIAGPPLDMRHPSQELKILVNSGYSVAYDEQLRSAVYVAFRFKPPMAYSHHRFKGKFLTDNRVFNPVHHEDYTRSGYSRGHMAPSYGISVYNGEEAGRETFLLSNVLPQRQSLNSGLWKRIEMEEAKEYPNQFGTIWVITGPLFSNQEQIKRTDTGIAIPDRFFRIQVRLVGQQLEAQAFAIGQEISNAPSPAQYLVSVNFLEKATGLDFFPLLPDTEEEKLESAIPSTPWGDHFIQ